MSACPSNSFAFATLPDQFALERVLQKQLIDPLHRQLPDLCVQVPALALVVLTCPLRPLREDFLSPFTTRCFHALTWFG